MDRIKWLDDAIDRAMEVARVEGHERALEWLTPLLFDEPGYGRLHNALGTLYYYYAEDALRAEAHLRLAIRFDPDLVAAYDVLVEIFNGDDRHDETIRVCEGGLKARKTNKSRLLESIGNAWELKEKYRRAIRHYRKALRHSVQLWDCKVLEESINRCKRKRR